jgi:hypothetical protein
MMYDFGTGNNNKLNWVLENNQKLITFWRQSIAVLKRGEDWLSALKITLHAIDTRIHFQMYHHDSPRRASFVYRLSSLQSS